MGSITGGIWDFHNHNHNWIFFSLRSESFWGCFAGFCSVLWIVLVLVWFFGLVFTLKPTQCWQSGEIPPSGNIGGLCSWDIHRSSSSWFPLYQQLRKACRSDGSVAVAQQQPSKKDICNKTKVIPITLEGVWKLTGFCLHCTKQSKDCKGP